MGRCETYQKLPAGHIISCSSPNDAPMDSRVLESPNVDAPMPICRRRAYPKEVLDARPWKRVRIDPVDAGLTVAPEDEKDESVEHCGVSYTKGETENAHYMAIRDASLASILPVKEVIRTAIPSFDHPDTFGRWQDKPVVILHACR